VRLYDLYSLVSKSKCSELSLSDLLSRDSSNLGAGSSSFSGCIECRIVSSSSYGFISRQSIPSGAFGFSD
jgi:hypothetical protein